VVIPGTSRAGPGIYCTFRDLEIIFFDVIVLKMSVSKAAL